jgi:hypothetical protein
MKYKPMLLLAVLLPSIAGATSDGDFGTRFAYHWDHRH